MLPKLNSPFANSKSFKSFFIFFVFIFLITSQNSYSQTATKLELGSPVEREIKGGEAHLYTVSLAASQYAKLKIEQLGVNVIIRSINAEGKPIIEFDAEMRNNGDENVELTSETAGDVQLKIEPRQNSAKLGRYKVSLLEEHAATPKEIALNEAKKLITQSNRLWVAGSYAEGLPLIQRALEIRQRELGEEHTDVGQAYLILGNIIGDLGDLAKCEEYYGKALEIWEKTLGKENPNLGRIFTNWGVLHVTKGDYIKAETFYNRALIIYEKSLDPDNLSIANVINNLASISRLRGDSEKAIELFRRALAIREKNFGPEHRDVAQSLNNLANVYDDPAISEPLYLRSLAIREKVLPPDHQDIAQSLYNLALIYIKAGDVKKAEPMCKRALEIFEKALGTEHYISSYPVNLLAYIYSNTGDYEQSEKLYLQAIAIKEKSQGLLHPELGDSYANLANLYVLKGEIEKAIAAQKRANEILEYNTSLNMTVGSERDKFNYLETLRKAEYQTLTLNLKNAAGSKEATELAMTSVLQHKGRVLDAMSDNIAALRRRSDKQDQALLDNLNGATAKLVQFVLTIDRKESLEEYRRQLKKLEDERDSIENQISRRNSGFYSADKSISLKEVQAAIPAKTVLIEFAIYQPVAANLYRLSSELPLTPGAFTDVRYAVFVVNSKGEVHSKDLGDAKTIDAAIEEWRKSLREPERGDVQKIARTIDEKILQPVRSLLGDANHLLISPDGALNLIPFEALVDEKGKYLIEDFSVTYLTSGRDLLRMQKTRENNSNSLIIADPSFGTLSAGTNPNGKISTPKKSIVAPRDLSETYFAPLTATLAEARAIREQFPAATMLTGTEANEQKLLQTEAPRILHIATHGFFLENTEELNFNSTLQKRNSKIKLEPQNPLLRSGIALAGANKRDGNVKNDGILTALEASGLNLLGTKLVVLSACDTGLGDVKNGEGVYGLRRAFVLAGTESLVMSLWEVSDYATKELMSNFYKNLKNGMRRGEALRQVKLEMIKQKDRKHPFYWAAFIQSGEWANLDGKR